MVWEPYIISVILIVFISTVIRSTFGFGDALIAMPLLSLLLPIQVSAPLVTFISLTTSILIVSQDWRSVQLGSASQLFFAALLGMPLGLIWLKQVDEKWVKLALATVILGFSFYSLSSFANFELHSDRTIWGFGFCSGILGGAYNAFGPPLVIYGALRRWPASEFRATIQGFVLPLMVMILIARLLSDIPYQTVLHYYLPTVPILIIAVLIGRRCHMWVKDRDFSRYIHALLILIGGMLLIQVFRS